MEAVVHDSGGSVIDVPVTPEQQKPSHLQRHRRRQAEGAVSPSLGASLHSQWGAASSQLSSGQSDHAADQHLATTAYEDGTSPSKLRALIASFTATRTRLTPSKLQAATQRAALMNEDEDEEEGEAEGNDDNAGESGGANVLMKSKEAGERRLRDSLQSNRMTYSPRTKARKRLRGEVVVTPGKTTARSNGSTVHIRADGVEDSPSSRRRRGALAPSSDKEPLSTRPPRKKQRGMGTLRDFGFASASKAAVAPPQQQLVGMHPHEGDATEKKRPRLALGQQGTDVVNDGVETQSDDESEDDDDEIMGPSPSVRKIADVLALAAFQPLFSTPRQGAAGRETNGDAPSSPLAASVSDEDMIESSDGMPSGEDFSAVTSAAANDDDDENSSDDEKLAVRAYERHSHATQRGQDMASYLSRGMQQADEDSDDECTNRARAPGPRTTPTPPNVAYAVKAPGQALAGSDDDSEDSDAVSQSVLLRKLSLSSPQCKRARRAERQRAAQRVRALLVLDEGAIAAQDVEAQRGGAHRADDEDSAALKGSAGDAARKTAKMLSAPRKRGVHAGRAKAAATLEQAHEQQQRTGPVPASQGNSAGTAARPALILRRGREEDADDSSADGDGNGDEHDAEAGSRIGPLDGLGSSDAEAAAYVRSDDDWASDVGSDEYGLGDGVMDDYDVV